MSHQHQHGVTIGGDRYTVDENGKFHLMPAGLAKGLDDYEAGRIKPNDEFLNANLDGESTDD